MATDKSSAWMSAITAIRWGALRLTSCADPDYREFRG